MSAPIIISGTTGGGTRFVQYWAERAKIHGQQLGPICQASMHDGQNYAPRLLDIAQGIEPEWIDRVLADFEVFRRGGQVAPTHTVVWNFGSAIFTPVEPAPPAELEQLEVPLFDLEEAGA